MLYLAGKREKPKKLLSRALVTDVTCFRTTGDLSKLLPAELNTLKQLVKNI